jgi:hypothetical protein
MHIIQQPIQVCQMSSNVSMRNFRRVFFSARSAGAKMSFALEIELREAAIADAILH